MLLLRFPVWHQDIPVNRAEFEMNRSAVRFFTLFLALLCLSTAIFAQPNAAPPLKSLEISEDDGLPVLIKHLPEWENVRSSTVFVNNAADLKKALPDKAVLDQIDFTAGTEAVTANYPAGKLLIVEFTNPQGSVDADSRVLSQLAVVSDPSTVYRRVGNYNVFVFDAADPAAAGALIDQVKYEKAVQWLGEDPFLLKKLERYFVTTARDIFISTVIWIVSGLGVAVVSGLIAGFFFYRFREHQRNTRTAYSDAGGLTRLNLDGLSE